MMLTLAILGMAVITLATRATLLVLGDRVRLPPLLTRALEFVPVAVLTALIVPMALAPGGGGLALTWRNPHLVGALASLAAILLLPRQPLLAIVVGLAVFFGWQFGVAGG